MDCEREATHGEHGSTVANRRACTAGGVLRRRGNAQWLSRSPYVHGKPWEVMADEADLQSHWRGAQVEDAEARESTQRERMKRKDG